MLSSPDDEETRAVVASTPGARLHVTTAFTDHGAKFNKGLALNEGFRLIDRDGWIWVHDADILFPERVPLDLLQPGKLHGCRRRVLTEPTKWHPCMEWRTVPFSRDGGPIGFTQIFRGDDPVLKDKPYWYEPTFTHAGGGDAFFMEHWPPSHRTVLPFDVLHLGHTDTNWFGTSQEARDMMARFVRENGWRGAARKHSPEAAKRAPEIVERVQVPGYAPSNFELPFVRRTRQLRGR